MAVAALITAATNKKTGVKPGALISGTPFQTARGDSQRVEAIFALRNDGDGPVRVVSVESGCGCAEPYLTSNQASNGQVIHLHVSAMPPATGERTVSFTLRTDSEATPSVVLRLRLISDRKPPFLLSVEGDLTYNFELLETEKRRVVVRTIETKDKTLRPFIKNDIDFLDFQFAGVTESLHSIEGAFERSYQYDVSLKGPLPPSVFRREIEIVDPWSQDHKERLVVWSRNEPRVKIVPSFFTLNPDDLARGRTLKLFVVSKTSLSVNDLRVEAPRFIEASPLNESSNASKTQGFQLRLKPGEKAAAGDYEVRVRANLQDQPDAVAKLVIRGNGL